MAAYSNERVAAIVVSVLYRMLTIVSHGTLQVSPNYCLFESLNEEEHTVVIRPDNRRFEKAEIYKMNPKRITETEYFNEFNTYLGYILLVGDIIQN